MAKIKLTESELRNIIKNIIVESKLNESINTTQVELSLETDDFIPFNMIGILYDNRDGSYDISNYWIVDGSYDPVFESEINEWVSNNDSIVREKLLQQASDDAEIAYDETNEYNPEEFM